jgi:chemotaxis protein MotB
VWPPFVDAVTLVLAAFVLMMLVVAAGQRVLIGELRERDRALQKLRADKERVERRLQALAAGGLVEVEGDKVILQGEVLFDVGSAELVDAGRDFVTRLAGPLRTILESEPEQLVMVAGHTDDVPIRNERFASNWELSTTRAVSVARVLSGSGIPARRIVAAGFGPYHPRAPNDSPENRRRNRRIEVLILPLPVATTP